MAKRCDDDSLIIASDLMVELDGKEIGKPKTEQEAFEMLDNVSGRQHKLIVGLCIINNGTKEKFLDFQEMEVKFRKMTEQEINDYIKNNPVLEYASAYGANAYDMFDAKFNGNDLRYGMDPKRIVLILEKNGIVI